MTNPMETKPVLRRARPQLLGEIMVEEGMVTRERLEKALKMNIMDLLGTILGHMNP